MTIYTDQHAEKLKAIAGRPWRPSNGTEGDMFAEAVCCRCERGPDSCEIASAAWFYLIYDPGYPKEWQIGHDGQPRCTAFRSAENG